VQDPPKFTQKSKFGLKTNPLATLIPSHRLAVVELSAEDDDFRIVRMSHDRKVGSGTDVMIF
jgi:hypothetical protein